MPETMMYVDRRLPFLTNEEKRELMEHILRSMTFTVAYPESSSRAFARRRPGGLRGRVRIAPDFDSSSDEIADLFENSSI